MSKIIKILSFEIWDIVIAEQIRDWKGIIFHHTVFEDDDDQGEHIDLMHRKGKRSGYPPFRHGMGYHFLVNRSGAIEIGKRWLTQLHGAHCRTKDRSWNFDYIGIALSGNFEIQKPTDIQVAKLLRMLNILGYKIGVPHKLLVNTLCPGKNFPYKEVFDCLNFMKVKKH